MEKAKSNIIYDIKLAYYKKYKILQNDKIGLKISIGSEDLRQ